MKYIIAVMAVVMMAGCGSISPKEHGTYIFGAIPSHNLVTNDNEGFVLLEVDENDNVIGSFYLSNDGTYKRLIYHDQNYPWKVCREKFYPKSNITDDLYRPIKIYTGIRP